MTAKRGLDFKIRPETETDYYAKLKKFDEIRSDFLIPKTPITMTSTSFTIINSTNTTQNIEDTFTVN